MFITNRTKGRVTLDGIIGLSPLQKDKYVDESVGDLKERIDVLVRNDIISANEGLEKHGCDSAPNSKEKVEKTEMTEPKSGEKSAATVTKKSSKTSRRSS